jgi:hypothetical protein
MGIALRLAQSVGLRECGPAFNYLISQILQTVTLRDGVYQKRTCFTAEGCFGTFNRTMLGWWAAPQYPLFSFLNRLR